MNTKAFVYLWQDARQKPYRYYLGYHKGHPDDGYTHSSTVFESFNKDNIPSGVKRRILATGSAEEMMELENKLLNNRKESKWDRYYNATVAFPPYMWDDPEYCKMQSEKMSEMAKKQWEDPEYRNKMSETSKKLWKDPEYRNKMSETSKKLWKDPEFQKKMSEKTKKLWDDPEYRKMQSEKTKKLWDDPDFRKMQSESVKKLWKDPEYREMRSEKTKKQWKDPEFQKMHSEKLKKQWKDPEFREKVTCNVCGFVGLKPNIARWHNENCKYKDTNTLEKFLKK